MGERNEVLCVVGIEVMISRGNEFTEWGGVKNEQQRTENRTLRNTAGEGVRIR